MISMNLATHIRKIVDQLMYNQLYAPDYPAEDRTNLECQAVLIDEMLAQATASEKREDVGDWLRLGSRSVAVAFEKYRKRDEQNARKDIEAAITYLRNASSRKPHKRSFITTLNGTTKPVS